ncbi:mitogen-activated protein kinase kinase kinase 20-like [Humulus lupulus]|uniref:mitogen-activated protein kinase kinase kinase 20-like n=1 Tax=Humulus lupulus TaxID=3486 RepID=UPI002B4011E3|nr:mitogen-activated protein kinase kinase kinase 20-like [Humulus lupulus]
MEWVRGEQIGRGSFATISKTKPRKGSPLMAVKSSKAFETLENEKRVLDRIGTCSQIIKCYGVDKSVENGECFHNLLLEYASGGSLSDLVKIHGGRLPEPEIRRHTRSILKGLSFIHSKGFVHCDIKLQNILMFDNGTAKIADFGLAKEISTSSQTEPLTLRGTPLYLAPESVKDNEYECPSDIWALGCAVVEMVTGKPVWNYTQEPNIWALLLRIGGEEVPEIPSELSEEGKDFLSKSLIKDSKKRWTAEMLLNHSFVCGGDDESDNTVILEESSPRCPLDFPTWEPNSPKFSPDSFNGFEFSSSSSSNCFTSPENRLRQLVSGDSANWSFSESWVRVRN